MNILRFGKKKPAEQKPLEGWQERIVANALEELTEKAEGKFDAREIVRAMNKYNILGQHKG